jgi:hypothetical protein
MYWNISSHWLSFNKESFKKIYLIETNFDFIVCYDIDNVHIEVTSIQKLIIQFQHHNITSDKWSDQNNERFYHVKQTVENRRPSKMGDVATLLFVHSADRQSQVMKITERHFFQNTERTYHCIIMHIFKKQKQKQSIIKLNVWRYRRTN